MMDGWPVAVRQWQPLISTRHSTRLPHLAGKHVYGNGSALAARLDANETTV